MASVCFYFQVHQPWRVKHYRIFDVGHDHNYFHCDKKDNLDNRKILEKVARKCYIPANETMLRLLNRHPEFHISYSISGVAIEQFEEYMPEVLESFKRLVDTGRVEILGETYYHSLSFLYSREEFRQQVKLHSKKIKEVFGVKPTVFRNTELIYNNELAQEVEAMKFKGVIAEGADHILGWRSPNFVYKAKGTENLKLLLKNYRLSDDIAFRFSSREWNEYPLTADKFSNWVSQINGCGEIVNLFMDYETFGEHQWEDTGIFHFLDALPSEILKHPDNDFVTPSQAVQRFHAHDEVDFPYFVSWADTERDLSAWLSNEIQHDAIQNLYNLEAAVRETKDKQILQDWRRLQTSDHFYYMCTKWFADGDVHKYFSPYESPYEAFISCMNALKDLTLRVERKNTSKKKKTKKTTRTSSRTSQQAFVSA